MKHPMRMLVLLAIITVFALTALVFLNTDASAEQGLARSRTEDPLEKAFNPEASVEHDITYYIDYNNRTIRANFSTEGDEPDKWEVAMMYGDEEIDKEDTFEIRGGGNPKTVTITYVITAYSLKDLEQYKGYTLALNCWCDILEEGDDEGKDSNITSVDSIVAAKNDAEITIGKLPHNNRISLISPTNFPLVIRNTGWKDNNEVHFSNLEAVDSSNGLWHMQVQTNTYIYELDSLAEDDEHYIEITGDPLLTAGTYTIKIDLFIGDNGHVSETFTVEVPNPDLQIYEIILSHTTAVVNKDVTIKADIINYGGYVESVEIEFYVQTPGGPLHPFGERKVVKGLTALTSRTAQATYANDELSLKKGQNATLTFAVKIDPLGNVMESDTSNNYEQFNVEVFRIPSDSPSFASSPQLIIGTVFLIALFTSATHRKRRK